MKPVSKDGSAIYPEVFRKLQAVGAALERNGYLESAQKPNLFGRDYGSVRFYADLRGTEEVPVWSNQRALFYWFWHPKPGPAPEIRQRTVLLEWVRLFGVPLRLSHELAYDETETRSDAALVEQFDYEERRALFVGPHASWADERFAAELGQLSPEQIALRGESDSSAVSAAAGISADPAGSLRMPGAERKRRRVTTADDQGRGARLVSVFGSESPVSEVVTFYERELQALGWQAVPHRPRVLLRRDPGDPWAHDADGRTWMSGERTFRLFLLGGQDRIAYGLTAAGSAFEVWLEGEPLHG